MAGSAAGAAFAAADRADAVAVVAAAATGFTPLAAEAGRCRLGPRNHDGNGKTRRRGAAWLQGEATGFAPLAAGILCAGVDRS